MGVGIVGNAIPGEAMKPEKRLCGETGTRSWKVPPPNQEDFELHPELREEVPSKHNYST